MVDYIVNENGVERQATDVEKAEIDARNKAWTDDAPNRKLKQVKEIRLEKLIETDYLAMSDNVMSDEIKNFRKSMRDIPQDFSTEEQYDLLLARDEETGELTHSIWSKP
tara:strand:+ start:593 stop:919 length:327 start_codon:yes stop_codon:yes gene_type:complete